MTVRELAEKLLADFPHDAKVLSRNGHCCGQFGMTESAWWECEPKLVAVVDICKGDQRRWEDPLYPPKDDHRGRVTVVGMFADGEEPSDEPK